MTSCITMESIKVAVYGTVEDPSVYAIEAVVQVSMWRGRRCGRQTTKPCCHLLGHPHTNEQAMRGLRKEVSRPSRGGCLSFSGSVPGQEAYAH